MRKFLLLAAAATTLFGAGKANKVKWDEWRPIFDGSSLNGWKAASHPEAWTVKDGSIRGEGTSGALLYTGERCLNCEWKAYVRTSPGGSAGMLIRAGSDGRGYGARNGILAGFGPPAEPFMAPDGWWVQRVVIEGNHIQVFVNEKQTVDFIDEKNTFTGGFVGVENPGGTVEFRNIVMRELPPPKSPLIGTWRLNQAQSKPGPVHPPNEIRILEERDGLRYQSSSGVNYFARTDGYDYRVSGAPAYDHVSIEETNLHKVHDALRIAKIRKKIDERVYMIHFKLDREPAGSSIDYLSPDRKTLTIEGSTKSSDGAGQYTEVFDRIE